MGVVEIGALILVGLAAGLLASAIGVGGGIIFVPALAVLFSFDQHIAQATSLAVILPTAIVGTIGHARAERVLWRTAVPLAIAGSVGGVVGAQIALHLEDVVLRRMFAALLFAVSLQMAWRSWRLVQVNTAIESVHADGGAGDTTGRE